MRRSPAQTLLSLPIFAGSAAVLFVVIVVLFALVLLATGHIAALDVVSLRGLSRNLEMLLESMTSVAAGLAAALVTRFWLGVSTPRLGLPAPERALPEVTLGIAIGGVPILVAGVLYLATGGVVSWAPGGREEALRSIVFGFFVFAPAALGEEWIFRHYFLSATIPHLGRLPAIGTGALLFALAHLPAPGAASPLAMLDIFVAGFGLGLAYVVTGSLWVSWMWHLAWNFTMGSFLGFAVSGYGLPSVAIVRSAGPDWWTGGIFGPEASVAGVVVDVLAVAAFWVISRRIAPGVWTGTATE